MPKDNEVVTISVLREIFAENNALLMRSIDTRFEQVNGQFEQMNERFEQVNGQFEQVNARFEHVSEEFEKVHEKFREIDTQFISVHAEIARVQRGVENLRDDVVDVLDRSIVPQLEDHRRDIALLKRVVVPV